MNTVDLWTVVADLPELSGDPELLSGWAKIQSVIDDRSMLGKRSTLEVLRDAAALQSGSLNPAWGGSWRWDLSKGASKAVVASAFLYGVLVSSGVGPLVPIVVPAVLPLLFDLERVRLTGPENRVLTIIGARSGVFERCGDRVSLYSSLPDEIRQAISIVEFEQFIESAINAGVATEHEGVVQVLPNGQTVFRLQIS